MTDHVRDVLAEVVARLQEVVPAVGRIVADVQDEWPDPAGRAWVERAELVRRSLGRELDAATELLRTVPADVGSGLPPAALPAGAAGAGRATRRAEPGPALPGTEADRVEDEDGVRIAELPPG